MAEAPIVSHGRGGLGNIGADATEYADAEIVREGTYGDQGDGAYSAGRGGAGNIGSPHVRPTSQPHDAEVIPEFAIRPSMDTGDYHTGRGGQGNVHVDKEKEEKAEKEKEKERESEQKKEKRKSTSVEGLADRLKRKLFGRLW
ncbi:hypothetical protein MPDQ_004234 [Monascus purpureus]|uniref:Uncharacterized protein n=1 Tax=Monascus purpureus TaxID=5098 RepID=A0A507R2S1_MONPU|nr:hypothetical protein MPDQ_004234 [Monascus purpureus]BDD63579.1 hypothetical protein MAP00_008451 [Monascus purpureus]